MLFKKLNIRNFHDRDNVTYNFKFKNVRIYKIKIFSSGPFSLPRSNYC